MITKFFTVKEGYSDYVARFNDNSVDEDVAYEIISDIARKVTPKDQLEFRIALLDIHDKKAILPKGFKYVNRVMGRIGTDKFLREEAVGWVVKTFQGCDFKITADCGDDCGEPIASFEVNRVYENAHPELAAQYMDNLLGSYTTADYPNGWVCPGFQLLGLAKGDFRNLDYHTPECVNITFDNRYEYEIKPPYLTTNFKTGQVLLAYLSERIDEDGYHMLPDHPDVFQATRMAVLEAKVQMEYVKTFNPIFERAWMNAEMRKNKAIAMAVSALSIPDEDEFELFLDNHWRKLLPYWNYKQNLDRYQPDRYRNPRI